jgi:hypothetical protein
MAQDTNTLDSIFLEEEDLYLPLAQWFQLLQDVGEEMSASNKEEYTKQSKKRWTRKVAHVDQFYPKLYALASEVHDHLLAHVVYFPNAKNKASNIHTIGKLIATRQSFQS